MLNKRLVLVLLLLVSNGVLAQKAQNGLEPSVVAGKGWGEVQLGARRGTVEAVLGKGVGEEGNKALEDVYFRDYPEIGIQVSYTNKEDRVAAIFFYNKHRDEHLVAAPVKTDKGIDWSASPQQVKDAYGKPKENYIDKSWRRMVFEGIDFRFENEVLVRIGIPGK